MFFQQFNKFGDLRLQGKKLKTAYLGFLLVTNQPRQNGNCHQIDVEPTDNGY